MGRIGIRYQMDQNLQIQYQNEYKNVYTYVYPCVYLYNRWNNLCRKKIVRRGL
jgi:hypothetical protein